MRKHALAGSGVGLLSAFVMILGPAAASGAEGGKPTIDRERSNVAADLCGLGFNDEDHSKYPRPFTQGTTNVRSGPSTSCGVVTQVNLHNKADYHCYDPGASDGHTWTFMRVKYTSYGWVRDDLLADGGSLERC